MIGLFRQLKHKYDENHILYLYFYPAEGDKGLYFNGSSFYFIKEKVFDDNTYTELLPSLFESSQTIEIVEIRENDDFEFFIQTKNQILQICNIPETYQTYIIQTIFVHSETEFDDFQNSEVVTPS